MYKRQDMDKANITIRNFPLSVAELRKRLKLKEKLLQVKGVSEVNISRQDYQPEYQVDFDREKLALHGLNLSTASH